YQTMLAQWESSSDPRERLTAYVDQNLADAESLKQYGCPIGSLCTDLRKQSDDLGDQAAGIFRMTMTWAAQQFEALGFDTPSAEARAMHLLTGIQGAAVLSNALNSVEPMEREAAHLKRWIATTSP